MANYSRGLPTPFCRRHRTRHMVDDMYQSLSHISLTNSASHVGRMQYDGISFGAFKLARNFTRQAPTPAGEIVRNHRLFSSKASHNDFEPHTTEEINWKDVQGKIRELLTSRRVVLFMKGTPENPQCGFSAKLVAILKTAGVEDNYTFVNVLAHPVIREGIKRYSEWPTIPQLYVNGEFVGGCDVVSDLFETNHLHSLLSSATDTLPQTSNISPPG
eukprot:GHVS01039918.1.p1 GENE.GHVS01039918.1~~GHVS01039918.1.p1  ORF type:complete len:216 (+),score=15.12 GHVS01039918.1:82-729(+)